MEEINVGDTVEISSNEDGFLGSYFVAQVIEKIKNKHNNPEYEVEYETLLDDEDENKMYREKVEDYKVRPTPPVVRVAEFDVLDKVDVYDNDGWWVGRVTHKFDYVYTVYFESTADEWAYSFDRLRLHQEYRNGVWTVSSGRQNIIA